MSKDRIVPDRPDAGADDEDNRKADYIKFYSGDAPNADRPVLLINYELP